MEQGFEGTRGCLGARFPLEEYELELEVGPRAPLLSSRGRPRWDAAEVEAPGKESQRSAPLEGHLGASG